MIRFAIFAAVSTKPQASKDKVSLTDQVKFCRQDGLNHGWKETAGPFIVPGHTRTRYINLRDAETAIPQLRDMLDAAQRKEFDVLIVYHYNRLRSLLDAVDKTLQSYGVQLTSHTAWTEPQDPTTYDPLSDVGKTIRFASGFTSEAEITEFRRRYKMGMPGRILKGLHKGGIPFGYRKPPGHELHPIHAPIVTRIKDLFLSGRSLWQIANTLNDDNITTARGSRWTDVNVRVILKNRFYSGEVSFGKTRIITDPRTDTARRVPNDPEKIVTAQGLHPPLWDPSTQNAIDAEFKKRGINYSGIRTHRLSNLLYCGVCGARVWVFYHGGRAVDKYRRWVCSKDINHVNIKETILLPRFIDELTDTLQHASNAPIPTRDNTQLIDQTKRTIEDLNKRLRRNHEAFEAGAMDIPEYTKRKTELKSLIKTEETKLHQLTDNQDQAAVRLQVIGGFIGILSKIPKYLTEADPQDVNNQLRGFIQKIIITPEDVKIELID
jgi:DNA invertase Pin-like site-specific DNA recombinase